MSELFPELDAQSNAPTLPAQVPAATDTTSRMWAGWSRPALGSPAEAAEAAVAAPAPEIPSEPPKHASQAASTPEAVGAVLAAMRAARAETQAQGKPRSARALFDRLLGLPGRFTAAGGCHVRFVEYPELDRVRLDVQGGGVPLFTLYLLEGKVEPSFSRSKHLSLVVAGAEIPQITQRVLQQIAARLETTTFAMLQRVVAADPSVSIPTALIEAPLRTSEGPAETAPGADGMTMPSMAWPPTEIDSEYLNSLGFGYSPPGAWRNFHQGHENIYGGLENSRGYCQHMAGNVVTVNHTDIECYYSSPSHRNGTVAFWNHLVADRDTLRRGTDHLEYFSDMTEIDVIKGGTPKLDKLLDQIADSGRAPEYLFLTRTCLTSVIGDDTQGSTERLKRRLPVVALDMGEDRDPKVKLFNDARERPEWLSAPKTPGAINLVGFPDMPGHHELVGLLAEAGLSINAWVLPAINVEHIERYMRAELQVLYDWPFLTASFKAMLDGLPMKSARPPVPFGVEGTRRFLLALAEALDRPTMFEDAWQRHHERVAPQWEAYAREARGYRVGFVGEELTLTRFFAQRNLLGIPVLEILEEMGFGIDIYMIRVKGSAPEAKVVIEGTRRTRYFESPEELEEILFTADTVAIYSELYFDKRLSRTGKNIFSVKDLGRIGLDGALEALRSMVEACRMPFYRTYAKYLGRPFEVGHGSAEGQPHVG